MDKIKVLKRTRNLLQTSTDYEWGRLDSCNLGFLIRGAFGRHQLKMEEKGDWVHLIRNFRNSRDSRADQILMQLFDLGFSVSELEGFEYLSSPSVLKYQPEKRKLYCSDKNDAIEYLNNWISLEIKRLLPSWNPAIEILKLESNSRSEHVNPIADKRPFERNP